ncbi:MULTISPECIES: helix-turn-helix domain-containing protein [Bacillus cereus group]|uniref:helix-turn-helix domain-containing protein n=1 Tax=Bacillus cereus group TaxID=86661 RepID=UPI000B4C1918|nr:helix-turn-helix domain-containing protein [Bacillus cereus group sp. BY2-1LC]KAB2157976.1 helix-turn-helix domain-containing protein [Cronobacter sakazakii]MDA2180453.1 helix-turn-helix domain-containing protein [Bacillus cereus]HDT6613911.1 helix-turn-helix domain-containing protein [Bacillus paranthracis]MDA1824152.1 helix-turn-helix domain-containing protein [Bacillus cereus group sp. BY2-1LC]HDT6622103.1 helix-turn-helix domain-containing protein [Bacillus paranthracis]
MEPSVLKASRLREEHIKWRRGNFENKKGFFPVFYGFQDFLPDLSSGAVSLFLYIGLHSNNQTGECYHDLTTIANFFGKSSRTISTWFKELEEQGLIERIQLEFNGVSHTFIKPYTSIAATNPNNIDTREGNNNE